MKTTSITLEHKFHKKGMVGERFVVLFTATVMLQQQLISKKTGTNVSLALQAETSMTLLCTEKEALTLRLSSSQRQYLQRATQQYAAAVDQASGYLETRGLSVEEVGRFLLGVVTNPLPGHEAFINRLAIPYMTASGVVDIRFRAMNGEEPKYMGMQGAKTTIYNTPAFFTDSKYICITEGEIDCLTMSVKTKHPTIGIPGANSWKPHYSKILDDYETVIVLADGDNAGSEFAKKIAREVPGTKILGLPEGEDVNSIFVQQGKDWLDERISECL